MIPCNFRNIGVGIADFAQDTFSTAFVKPFQNRPLELRFESALEITHTHMGQRGKSADIIDIFIIPEHEITETIVIANDKFQERIKLFRRIITTQKNA